MSGAISGEIEVTNHPPAMSVGRRCCFCHSGDSRLPSGGVRRFVANGAKPMGEPPYGSELLYLAICEGCVNAFAKELGFPTGAAFERERQAREAAEAGHAGVLELLARLSRRDELRRRLNAGEHLADVELDEADDLLVVAVSPHEAAADARALEAATVDNVLVGSG